MKISLDPLYENCTNDLQWAKIGATDQIDLFDKDTVKIYYYVEITKLSDGIEFKSNWGNVGGIGVD